jgi:hypothetical protein
MITEKDIRGIVLAGLTLSKEQFEAVGYADAMGTLADEDCEPLMNMRGSSDPQRWTDAEKRRQILAHTRRMASNTGASVAAMVLPAGAGAMQAYIETSHGSWQCKVNLSEPLPALEDFRLTEDGSTHWLHPLLPENGALAV